MRLIRAALAALTILFTAAFCKDPEPALRIRGSETMHAMMDLVAIHYAQTGRGWKLDVKGGGSNAGIRALLNGETDVAVASRALEQTEEQSLEERGAVRKEIVAYDCLVLAVHPGNPIKSLTLQQASDIFSGRITNWKDVGGPDLAIKVVIRDEDSGSTAYFRDHILRQLDLGEEYYVRERNREFVRGAQAARDNGEQSAIIQREPGAIGYMGMGSAEVDYFQRVKALDYAMTPNEKPITPTIPNVYNRTYRLSRPLFFIFVDQPRDDSRAAAAAQAAQLLEYMVSGEGQKLVRQSGSIRAFAPAVEVEGQRPAPVDAE